MVMEHFLDSMTQARRLPSSTVSPFPRHQWLGVSKGLGSDAEFCWFHGPSAPDYWMQGFSPVFGYEGI